MDQAFVPDKTSKLVIRVKMDASSNPAATTIDNSEVMEYSPFALGVFVVVLLALGAAAYYYFSSSKDVNIPVEFVEEKPVSATSHENVVVIEPALTNPALAQSAPMAMNIPDAEVSPLLQSTQDPAQKVVLVPSQTAKSQVPQVQALKPQISKAQIPEPQTSHSPVLDVIENTVVDTKNGVKTALISEEIPVLLPEQTPALVQSEISPDDFPETSVNVRRAQFTYAINQREPVDLIDGFVPAKVEGLTQIYFFTELRNLKGQAIRHQWFREGKLKSELTFNVRGNRWRVNSSKRLNPAAIGDWRVNVVDEVGNVLVSKQFEYKLP